MKSNEGRNKSEGKEEKEWKGHQDKKEKKEIKIYLAKKKTCKLRRLSVLVKESKTLDKTRPVNKSK